MNTNSNKHINQSLINKNIEIKFTDKSNCELILGFIKELAEYEKLSHQVEATTESIYNTMFNPDFSSKPLAEAIICYVDNNPAGIAIFYENFSTFLNKAGLYIDDLFVKPEYRGQGLGSKMFDFLANIMKERDYGRMEWAVLDWNTKAMDFYKSKGAKPVDDWKIYRLSA